MESYGNTGLDERPKPSESNAWTANTDLMCKQQNMLMPRSHTSEVLGQVVNVLVEYADAGTKAVYEQQRQARFNVTASERATPVNKSNKSHN